MIITKNSFAGAESLEFPKFGNIEISYPKEEAETFTVFFDDGRDSDKKLRSILLKANSIVASISIRKYLESLEAEGSACLELGGDVERLSQVIQNRIKLERQLPARIAGSGEGALMAIVSAVRAPNTFYQVLVFTGDISLSTSKAFCEDSRIKATFSEQVKKITLEYVTPEDLTAIILHDKNNLNSVKYNYQQMFRDAAVEEFDIQDNAAIDAVKDIYDEDNDDELKVADKNLQDLPLIEVSLKNNFRDFFIIFFSGDGGWAAIDKDLGKVFSDKNIPVIGFNSLKYFWKKKDPKQLGSDLESAIRYYQKKLKLKKYFLMGFSLGADVLPSGFNFMSDSVKQDAEGAVLLSPSRKVDFEVNLTDWLPVGLEEDGDDVLSEIRKMNMKKLLCIYGQEEDDSLCNDLDTKVFNVLKLPGGHHYDGDYNLLASRILNEMKLD